MEKNPSGEAYQNLRVYLKINFHEQRLTFTGAGQVEIIEHTAIQTSSTMSKDELKVFMVSSFSNPYTVIMVNS